MSNSAFISLEAKIKKLKEVVKDLDTNTLSTYCFWEMYKFATLGQKIDLQSPARQMQYLFGIASSANEPVEPSKNIDGKLTQIVTLLNEIFGKYMRAYFPTKEDLKNGLEDEWHKVREIAMPMFLGYFFEGQKIATMEYKNIIKSSFNGFEDEIKEHFGLNHHEMLEIIDLIGDIIQKKYDNFQDIMRKLKLEHEKLKDIKVEDFEDFMNGVKERTEHLSDEFHSFMSGSVSFNFDSIRASIGNVAVDSFVKTFVTVRGESPEIKFITDDNPFTYKPIITINNYDYFLPMSNAAYEAIILNIEQFFKASKYSERYRKSRDVRLEQEAFSIFKEFFPESATIVDSVFETNDSHNEHDLIILHDRKIIIVEAKAAPRRAPLREPNKAYIRIRDDFKRKSGIQSASDQANNLRRLILTNVETPLYNKKGELILTIKQSEYDDIYCVCITKDDFGMLATDLTLMLEKNEGEPYPWVISIQDLKFYIECLKDINLSPDYLIGYISERINLHGKVIANDELEYAGAYLNYDGFDFVKSPTNSKVFLDMSESRVFDEIHLEKINGRKYVHKIKKSTYGILDRNKMLSKFNKRLTKKDITKAKSKRKEQKKSRKHNR
ncbi:hypothetical protein ABR33_19255 [Enterobacter bugandensis]|uniref:hypothetical protein n=1 Tax=Enterobacter bugandensis TaxID=881260 RepID=UPI0006430410|nr:hypothetical protein [Enterobacter bugandensis]KLQ28316.1 hypothetical protein ABR33_19255 [Enterobacter bugandensis]